MTSNQQFDQILNTLYCKIADKAYKNFVFKKYKVGCLEEIDVTHIDIIENKIKLLREAQTSQRLRKTDIDSLWNEDVFLNDCKSSFLEKYKHG